MLLALLFCVTGFLVYFLTQPGTENPFNYFTYLADAFLHGRLYVTDTPFYFEELVIRDGKSYVIYPPMPAVLIMPFVAVWGTSFNQALASLVLGGVNISLVYLITRRLTGNRELQFWITLLFGFGSIHWYTATVGSVWYFAQITSMFFLLLAVHSTLSGRSSLLIGLLLGASYWSRLTTVLSLPFFIIMISNLSFPDKKEFSVLKKIRIRPILLLCAGLGIFILLNFLYNYLRFGSPFDVAYALHTITPAKEKVSPWFNKGLFSLSYIRHHLYVFLLHPPVFIDSWPYVIPSKAGLSVFITTPAFIFAFFAGWRNRLTIACWSAIIPIAFLIFIKSGTGWTQFGYRYAMDFYPFLLLLTVIDIGDKLKWYHRLLIILGILVNIWGVLFINIFGWYRLY
ncbi:MAG: hypothetical protein RIG61_03645 [Deltaproteobacteria bacterium]